MNKFQETLKISQGRLWERNKNSQGELIIAKNRFYGPNINRNKKTFFSRERGRLCFLKNSYL